LGHITQWKLGIKKKKCSHNIVLDISSDFCIILFLISVTSSRATRNKNRWESHYHWHVTCWKCQTRARQVQNTEANTTRKYKEKNWRVWKHVKKKKIFHINGHNCDCIFLPSYILFWKIELNSVSRFSFLKWKLKNKLWQYFFCIFRN